MKKVGVYCWWSAGGNDGDSYDDEVEVTDEEYSKLKKFVRNYEDYEDIHSEDIEDEEIRKLVKRIESEALETLEENSYDGYQLSIEEEDDDWDEESGFEEWYDSFEHGAQIQFGDLCARTIVLKLANGEEKSIHMNVFDDEYSVIRHFLNQPEKMKDDEDLKELFEELKEQVLVDFEIIDIVF